jgi:plastocyanin
MNNEILFYVFGIALAVSAVLVSIVGLRMKDFPGKAFPVVVLWFAILIGGATTFGVLHSKAEKADHEVEYVKAGKEIEKETSSGPFETGAAEGESTGSEEAKGEEEEEAAGKTGASGPGGTVELAASESELKFDTTELTSKPGKVTIDFNNPSAIPHDVEVEDGKGEVLGGTKTIASSEESATLELEPGTYTFFCSVPGHREAGMEGKLVVK